MLRRVSFGCWVCLRISRDTAGKKHIGYEIQGMFLETDLLPLARQDVPQQHQLHMQMPYQQPEPQQRYVSNQQSPFSNRGPSSETDTVPQSFDNDECLYPTYTNL